MTSDCEAGVPATKKPNLLKRLYNWVLGWADNKWGSVALFVLAFAESSFFPVPPDVLLIALCLGCTRKSFKYALICLVGSLAGAAVGYGLGAWAWDAVSGWFVPGVFSQESFDGMGAVFERWNFWIVFTAGFTPIPYKLFTITAGVFDVNFVMFMVASIVSRGLRFFLVGWLIWKFGKPIKSFIDKYFNLVAIGLTVLIVGGVVLMRYAI